MKLMRLAMCVAVFALIGGIAFSQDMDIRSLQAKLAAQEARLNDLQAKMAQSGGGGTADNTLSIRKNAKITIGGDIQTRMYQQTGNVKSEWVNNTSLPGGANTNFPDYTATGVATRNKVRATDFRVHHARINFKLDVNDYFEAYIRANLHDGGNVRAGNAEKAYIKWKNVCNSGFSLLIGRNDFVFGGGNEAGSMYSGFYGGSGNDSMDGEMSWAGTGIDNIFNGANTVVGNWRTSAFPVAETFGMLANGSAMMPAHTGWDYGRTTQITPSWKSQDGKFEFELSYMQALEKRGASGARYGYEKDDYTMRRSINDGFGTFSTRLTWKPIEGLKIVASFANLYNNVANEDGIPYWKNENGWYVGNVPHGFAAKSNQAANLHVAWNPCFLPAFKIWGAWVHDWNAGWVDGMDADTFQLGLSYMFTDKLGAFAIGEYMRHKYDRAGHFEGDFYKSKAWASYVGVKYNIGYGVSTELGWRHEEIKYQDRGGYKHTKGKLDTVYGRLVLDF